MNIPWNHPGTRRPKPWLTALMGVAFGLVLVVQRGIWQEELEDFVPAKVFDAHTHIYRWAFDLDPNKATGPFAGELPAPTDDLVLRAAELLHRARRRLRAQAREAARPHPHGAAWRPRGGRRGHRPARRGARLLRHRSDFKHFRRLFVTPAPFTGRRVGITSCRAPQTHGLAARRN